MKIKLPRRRKKAYIRKYCKVDYIAHRIVNEVLCEEENTAKNRSFTILKLEKGSLITVKKY